MRKNLALILGLFLVALILTFVSAQETNSVVSGNNQFALDLYSKYKSNQGNIFFSPYSITSALAMTYEGARGDTAAQMQSVLHLPQDDTVRRQGFLDLNNRINKKDKKYQLSVANALWIQKDYSFLESYFKLIEEYYSGKITNLDFAKDTENSRLTINNWVELQTNEKIKNLIPSGGIDALTRLVLTNAVYFKGKWQKQFDKIYTEDKDFNLSADKKVRAPFMYKEDNFRYIETENLQVLELPYEGNELTMLIFLPKSGSFKAVEDSLTFTKIGELKAGLVKQEVEVYLPKFKFENKYFMSKDLKQMGMPLAFSDAADFSGITGRKDLYISDVIHQAFIDVNEEGTEAVAATAVVMAKAMFKPAEPKIFKADRPFIFLIEEKTTGNILFIGRVSDPTRVS